MTNPKPTEGWAIIAKDGRVLFSTCAATPEGAWQIQAGGKSDIAPHLVADDIERGFYAAPVTIIPTADLVKEAARVLLEHLTDQKCAECDCNSGGIDCNWIASKIDGAALRALAGQGGE